MRDRYPEIEPYEHVHARPGSELVLLDDAGHGSGPGLANAIVAATDRFAPRNS